MLLKGLIVLSFVNKLANHLFSDASILRRIERVFFNSTFLMRHIVVDSLTEGCTPFGRLPMVIHI